MHHIVDNLWLGNQEDADALIRHNPDAITAILNVRGPDAYRPAGHDQSAEHPGKAYKWIPAPDTGKVWPGHVAEAVAWLAQQTLDGRRILIHCKFGISRSPAFLAAFMVKSGLSADLDQARAAISARRHVLPAALMEEARPRVATVSTVTGLPNGQAFQEGKPSPWGAVADIDLMRSFNRYFGQIAGDALLRRLGRILIGAGLDAYHCQGDEILCKGRSREELTDKLARSRELFRESFQLYAEGRIQTIEGADFSYGVGATPHEQMARLEQAKKAKSGGVSPEWLRRVIGDPDR